MEHLSLFQAAMLRKHLKDDKNNIIVAPDPVAAAELVNVYEFPADRVKILACVSAVRDSHGKYLVMSKRQYSYYSRKERDIDADDGE